MENLILIGVIGFLPWAFFGFAVIIVDKIKKRIA